MAAGNLLTPGRGRLLRPLAGAGLLVLALAAGLWAVAREQAAIARGHEAALQEAAAHPGTLVADPALPPGVVEVDLVPALPGLSPLQPATLHAGAASRPWSAEAPARFEGLRARAPVAISVAGPCVAAPASFDPPGGAHGARLDVRAVPVEPALPPGTTSAPHKLLEIAMPRPGAIRLRWWVGHVLVSEREVPRGGGVEKEADRALAEMLREEWKHNGDHVSPLDREIDQAVVVAPAARFDELVPVVAALQATRREIEAPEGDVRSVPVFRVRVLPYALDAAPPR